MKKGICFAALLAAGALGGSQIASASLLSIDLSAAHLAKGLFSQGGDSDDTPSTPPSSPSGAGVNGGSDTFGADSLFGGDLNLFVGDGQGGGGETTLGDLLGNGSGPQLQDFGGSLPDTFSDLFEDGESGGGDTKDNPPAPQQFDSVLPTDETIVSVPEPATSLLLLAGLAGLAFARKKSASA